MDLEAISINESLTSFTLYITSVEKKNEIRNEPKISGLSLPF